MQTLRPILVDLVVVSGGIVLRRLLLHIVFPLCDQLAVAVRYLDRHSVLDLRTGRQIKGIV